MFQIASRLFISWSNRHLSTYFIQFVTNIFLSRTAPYFGLTFEDRQSTAKTGR